MILINPQALFLQAGKQKRFPESGVEISCATVAGPIGIWVWHRQVELIEHRCPAPSAGVREKFENFAELPSTLAHKWRTALHPRRDRQLACGLSASIPDDLHGARQIKGVCLSAKDNPDIVHLAPHHKHSEVTRDHIFRQRTHRDPIRALPRAFGKVITEPQPPGQGEGEHGEKR